MASLLHPRSPHADLRSPSGAQKRHQKEKQKYYGFRSGPMSRIGQLFRSIPQMLLPHPIAAAADPILCLPKAVLVRTWTKRDQFEERTLDIWPLDRKDHKRGRAHRGRGCRYTPPRWEYERSMKGKRGLLDWDPLDLEDIDTIYDFAMNDDDEASDFAMEEAEDQAENDSTATNEEREADYDFLSDVDSEGDARSDLDERDSADGWMFVA